MTQFIKNRFSLFGRLPLCNAKGERGFYIGSFCFPLCVRCVSIITGIILTVFLKIIFNVKPKRWSFILWLFCILPCLIDGVLQYCYGIESNNLRRFVFGIICGYGIGSNVYFLIQILDKKLKKF